MTDTELCNRLDALAEEVGQCPAAVVLYALSGAVLSGQSYALAKACMPSVHAQKAKCDRLIAAIRSAEDKPGEHK